MPMLVYGNRGQPLKVEPVKPVAGVDIREDPPNWKVGLCHEFDRYTNGELLGAWDNISRQIEQRFRRGEIDQLMIEQFWPLQKYFEFREQLRKANGNSD